MQLTAYITCVLLLGFANCQTEFVYGTREPGDQLIHVKYLEDESPTPANLLLHFNYDDRRKVNWISRVECNDFSDSKDTYTVVVIDGGVGVGQNFIEFTLAQKDATYQRCQCNFYGFFKDKI